MNQAPPLVGYDLFSENRPLLEALAREGGGDWRERAEALGRGLAASRSSGAARERAPAGAPHA